ncbi:FHA DOMAIN PROTEIN [Salix viminalis]|uniref:FHA DOMAIN PROTEIN n=1 Tax=Salix viminalis TaxID=40686 RepID=A0A9Q0ZDX4_SALVM|nr:FHA DOMAIN PROTEIN [Salix viminalis]
MPTLALPFQSRPALTIVPNTTWELSALSLPWIPEDDVLLKNSIEAGASLESLAKGAVQFSRKFTVREIRDRWYSLLYDPVVSSEAAFHMTEFECSASTFPSKFSRAGNSKENKCFSGKRKTESVRSCYYALRKRICSQPFNSTGLSFLVSPINNNYVCDEYEQLSRQCMLGDPVTAHFALQESNLDMMHHAFPQIVNSGTAHAFDTQFHNTIQEDYSVEQDNIHYHIPHILGEDLSNSENRTVVEELSQQLPVDDDLFRGCSNFDGNDVLSSPVPECSLSFHNLEFSSPLPEMPIWRMDEGISGPDNPNNLGLCDKDLHPGNAFSLLHDGDIKNACLTGFDDLQKDPELKMEILSDVPQNSSHSTEYFLAEITNYLSNDDEGASVDMDGKDFSTNSYIACLNTILLNSPNNSNENHGPNVTEPEASTSAGCSGACPGNLWENRGSHCSVDAGCNSEFQYVSSTSVLDSHPEVKDGTVCCVLNTEDTEIPFNDDIAFPTDWRPRSVASLTQGSFQHVGKPNSLPAKELPSNKKGSVVPVVAHRDLENPGQLLASSQMLRLQMMAEPGLVHPVGDHSLKLELPGSDSTRGSAGFAFGGSTQFKSADTKMETLVPAKLKEETTETPLTKHTSHDSTDFLSEKPTFVSDFFSYPQTNVSAIKQVEDAPDRAQNHQVSHMKAGSSKLVANHSESDLAEPSIQSDDDVPCFSDIEAMILDMDLDPEDQDLYCSEEVSRYQHEDMKRAIMRLEQGAHSYMQRAIARHGAIAVIHGRHSKHYIKKSKVLLGRATEDVIVDIDLGREGHANIISRRQATINLDKNGSFYLKNLGKCPLSVNDKEIAPGQSLSLTSGCLIEIRGMPFIFETNQTCVKQYLAGTAQKNQT